MSACSCRTGKERRRPRALRAGRGRIPCEPCARSRANRSYQGRRVRGQLRASRAHRATVVDLGDRCGEPHGGGVLRLARSRRRRLPWRWPSSIWSCRRSLGWRGWTRPAPPSRPRELIKLRPAAAYRSMAGRILARAECAAAGAGRNRLIGQLMREALDCA